MLINIWLAVAIGCVSFLIGWFLGRSHARVKVTEAFGLLMAHNKINAYKLKPAQTKEDVQQALEYILSLKQQDND